MPFGFILADPLNNARQAAGCCLPLSAPAAAFRFCRPAAGTRSPIPATPINRCTISGTDGGTETILLFVLGCLFPAHFARLAWLFGALCWLTTATRICSGYQTLKRVTTTA
nr:Inner membrane protein YnjF [Klebsiella pneumoniae]